MVNAEKHKKLRKMNFIDIYFPGPFEMWLRDFFPPHKDTSYGIYFGGINGAINRKLNNLNPDNETWFKHTNGLMYAESNNELMEEKVVYTFAGIESRSEALWHNTQKFLEDIDVNPLFVDAQDYFNNKFDIFKIFDDAKKHDLLFIKNMDPHFQMFLLDYGLQECIPYIYFFIPEELIDDLDNMVEGGHANDGLYVLQMSKDPLYKRKGKIGFELYDNLKEWKKEVTAPTRNDPEYRAMKKRVKQRDNFTCQCCGYHNTEKVKHGLEVHHIYGYKDHLDYRVEDSNCVTLCNDCHKKYHSIYGKNNVTPFTFAKFIRDYNTYTQKNAQVTFDELFKGVEL